MPVTKLRLWIGLAIGCFLLLAIAYWQLRDDKSGETYRGITSPEDYALPTLNQPTPAPPLANLPSPTIRQLVLPMAHLMPNPESVGGQVFFVLDGDLHVARFDGQAAQLLVEGVLPESLRLSPDQRTLLYQQKDQQDYSVLLALNTSTLASVELDRHPTEFIDFEFSPNGEWVAYLQTFYPAMVADMRDSYLRQDAQLNGVDQDLTVTRVDGKGGVYWLQGVSAKAWLLDNTLVINQLDEFSGRYDRLIHVLPEEGQPTEENLLDYSISGGYADRNRPLMFMRARQNLFALIGPADLIPAPPTDYVDYGSVAVAPSLDAFVEVIRGESIGGNCRPVSLTRRGYAVAQVPAVLFEMPSVVDLRFPRWLPNDGILFTLWDAKNCATDTPTASLYFTAPYGETRRIATDLDIITGAPYTTSHDGRYVLWAGVDAETEAGFLAITNVLNGETSRLIIGTVGQHFGGMAWAHR